MDMQKIEKKWQKKWQEIDLAKIDRSKLDKKMYILEMFSYPSGSKLHVGHWYNYGPTDSYARFKKMQGYEVFQPMGFDAFGLPAENYAIKTQIHPKDSTEQNIDTMHKQLQKIGAIFDWDAEVITCREDYYKWTQWLFLQLYKNGLAYRKEAPVNWCPSCHTVLANEQVQQGGCERCGTTVVKKNLTQWFFKITDYAEQLLIGLDRLDWPEKTKLMQKNWIGKSTGAQVQFRCESGDILDIFTTRIDTIFGVSYIALAPEHPLVQKLTARDIQRNVEHYIDQTATMNEIERLSTTKEKTGIFIGHYALHPLTGKKIPIFIADYVLNSYGTGAVMGVPAHDERDFLFAKRFHLPIQPVIYNESDALPYTEYGKLINSKQFNGLMAEVAQEQILNYLEKRNLGYKKVNYRLRDWLISRQRYWGAPIPILYCPACGIVPVPENDLPVTLPYAVEFKPDGKSPLAKSKEFMHTTCPQCGKPATREVDTLDTFVCSSWYFLRYPDSQNREKPFDSEIINQFLPVDKYVGGAEHACMHLLYARFITKVLYDLKYINFDEPFTSLVHQGLILGPDGNKMSKSLGNVVSPDTFIDQYGADIFRLYLMFGFSYTDGGAWNDDGLKSIAKFLDRIERLITKFLQEEKSKQKNFDITSAEKELLYMQNNAIEQVTKDLEAFSFNTAIARLMEYLNTLQKYDALQRKNYQLLRQSIEKFILLLAPATPHFSEEVWEMLGHNRSIFLEKYPICDKNALIREEVEYALQINSKIKCKLMIASKWRQEEIAEYVQTNTEVLAYTENKPIKKIIIVPNKLINIIL